MTVDLGPGDLKPEFQQTPADEIRFEMFSDAAQVAMRAAGGGYYQEYSDEPITVIRVPESGASQVTDADRAKAFVRLAKEMHAQIKDLEMSLEARTKLLAFMLAVDHLNDVETEDGLQQVIDLLK